MVTSPGVRYASVLLGNILYPINWDKFPSMGPIVNYFAAVISCSVPPQGLGGYASSEDLSYDDSVANIKQYLKHCKSQDEPEAVSGATSEWGMYCIWNDMAQTNDVLKHVNVRWNYKKWEYADYVKPRDWCPYFY